MKRENEVPWKRLTDAAWISYIPDPLSDPTAWPGEVDNLVLLSLLLHGVQGGDPRSNKVGRCCDKAGARCSSLKLYIYLWLALLTALIYRL